MGAFFIHSKARGSLEFVHNNYFIERGFNLPRTFDLGKWTLNLYSKISVEHENDYSIGQDNIFVVGTVVYKGENYRNSLKFILKDMINNSLDQSRLIGSFTIIFYIGGKILILRDATGISNIYYDDHNTALSSSFLAVCDSYINSLTFCKEALLENISLGLVIGPDTIFNEIKRVEKWHIPNIDGIYFIKNDLGSPRKSYNSKEEAVFDQVNRIETYFKDISSLGNELGVDCGLTGGLDSRLLLAYAIKHFESLQVHSYWRRDPDIDLDVAKEISQFLGLQLKVVPAIHPYEMSDEELKNTISSSFLYYDGHIRMHSYWHEQYNTSEYRKNILGKYRLGIHGIGGEQYRNSEHHMFKKRGLKKWIKYELLYRYAGGCFSDKDAEKAFILEIERKICKALSIDNKKISSNQVKRYLNEIQIPSLRGVRTNMENSQIYFLSPFADPYLSFYAYNAMKFYGLSSKFQGDMISKLNPGMAAIRSSYGFDFLSGEPLSRRFVIILRELMPKPLAYKWVTKRKGSHNDLDSLLFENKFPYLGHLSKNVEMIKLPIKIGSIKMRSDLYPLIWSLGYLIERFKSKIDFNK